MPPEILYQPQLPFRAAILPQGETVILDAAHRVVRVAMPADHVQAFVKLANSYHERISRRGTIMCGDQISTPRHLVRGRGDDGHPVDGYNATTTYAFERLASGEPMDAFTQDELLDLWATGVLTPLDPYRDPMVLKPIYIAWWKSWRVKEARARALLHTRVAGTA